MQNLSHAEIVKTIGINKTMKKQIKKYPAGTTLYPTRGGNFQPRKDNGQYDVIRRFEYSKKSNDRITSAKDYSKIAICILGAFIVVIFGMSVSTYFETKAIKTEMELSKQAMRDKNQAFQKMLTDRVFKQLTSIAQNQLEQSMDVYDLSQNSLDLVENMNKEMQTKLKINAR